MKKRILAATLTATMASSIFGMTGNAAERELNINWLSSRGTSDGGNHGDTGYRTAVSGRKSGSGF